MRPTFAGSDDLEELPHGCHDDGLPTSMIVPAPNVAS